MHFVNSNVTLHRIFWFLFWCLAVFCAFVVLLYLWIALPVLMAIARGGSAHLWLFGDAGLFLVGALIYLAVVVHVVIKRRARGADGVGPQ